MYIVDPDTNFKYVINQNKNYSLKKSWNEVEIKKYYLSFIVKQDEKSLINSWTGL
jgi:hypothetical protein